MRLLSIEGRTLTVADADLLDGTPILDIKPYLPAADAFPTAKAGWVDEQQTEAYEVFAAPEFLEAAQRILALGGPDLLATARTSRSPSRCRAARSSTTSMLPDCSPVAASSAT